MTAPKLEQMKYWIVVPAEGTNQIKNPRFDTPDGVEDWDVYNGSEVLSGDNARHGAYSMKLTPQSGLASGVFYINLNVEKDKDYTFSCDVLGVGGQAMRIFIADVAGAAKATTNFIATGYWQRVEVTYMPTANATDYRVYVQRDSIASVEPIYIDGAQFEQASKATTLIHGYEAGCRWTGAIRNSPSYRSANTGLGGELLCINDYAKVITSYGLGMGDWNQIMTKMTSGGDMYQTHIRKSRNFTLVLAYSGDNQGDLQANRKVILDALRPDLLSNLSVPEQFGINWGRDERGHEQRIIRYQGFDANGNEATNPIDIVCVFQPSHNDIPDMPVYQREMLNFTIPSGLLQGAYNEGKELDLYAEFPAEYIVKRDSQGNWCKWNGSEYQNLITGLNGTVYCMAEGPDGKIYVGGAFTNAGGVAAADYLARWNPITEAWEAVGTPNTGTASINNINALTFDAAGILYIGGNFVDFAGVADADNFAKWDGSNWTALGSGTSGEVQTIAISPNGTIYIGGNFISFGGDTNCNSIAYYDTTAGNWKPVGTAGLNSTVYALAFAPNGDLYIGGTFTAADGTDGDYLCYWDGTAFNRVGTVELSSWVITLAFGATGYLYVGGNFINAGGIANADYIARWNGSQWEPLGIGTNGIVYGITVNSGKVYAAGSFTSAGGLILTDRVAVWSNGSWQPLDIDLPGSAEVYSILPASDGSLYIGGAFSTAGSSGVNAETGIVALNLNVASASANTYPVISVTGPGTLKSITNYRTGKSVMFGGLTLQAGEWIGLQLDPLNLKFRGGWAGRGNLMRYVVPGSDYGDFYLKPGGNALSLFMTDTDANTNAWITWTPLFWGLDGALL